MEPSKNNNQSAGGSSEPAFQGMPKPGQPLASTPKFSAHTPSALDRIMNPNIDKAPSLNSVSQTSPSAPATPSASSFKPYTPPAQTSTSQISVPQSNIFSQSNPSVSQPKPSVAQPTMSSASVANTAYKTSTPSMSSVSPTPTPPASSTASTIPKNSPLIASGMTPTMGALKPTSTGGHKSTLILIISAIVVLLLLGGGAYYWYTSSVTPSAEVENFDQNSNAQNSNSSSRPTSSFPTAVTSRPSGVSTSSPVMMQNNQAKSTTKPVTPPARVTRITTPFTQSQRSTVSSYIQANIDDLAIPKSSRGYEVTDISFDGPDRALVQYTNGTASYTAIAVASIDTADNVRILSFSLLEK